MKFDKEQKIAYIISLTDSKPIWPATLLFEQLFGELISDMTFLNISDINEYAKLNPYAEKELEKEKYDDYFNGRDFSITGSDNKIYYGNSKGAYGNSIKLKLHDIECICENKVHFFSIIRFVEKKLYYISSGKILRLNENADLSKEQIINVDKIIEKGQSKPINDHLCNVYRKAYYTLHTKEKIDESTKCDNLIKLFEETFGYSLHIINTTIEKIKNDINGN